MVSDILRPGDKVEINSLRKTGSAHLSETESCDYMSRIQGVNQDGTIDIAMPIVEGKYVLLHLGVSFEFVFYANNSLYKATGTVKERFKSNNIYMLRIELKTPLGKLQRREFYRFPCVMDFKYYHIDEEQAKLEDAEDILESLRDENFYEKEKKGTILDLSGGGARFVAGENLDVNQEVLCVIYLDGDSQDNVLYVRSKILTNKKLEAPEPKFEHRIEFVGMKSKTREEIIRYIFEEERRMRKSENR